MKSILLSLILLLTCFVSFGQHWEWAIHDTVEIIAADSAGNLFAFGNSKLKRYIPDGSLSWEKPLAGDYLIKGLVSDKSGNAYIAAEFSSLFLNSVNFYSSGNKDILLIKLDPAGTILWWKKYGSYAFDNVTDLYLRKGQLFFCGNSGAGAIFGADTITGDEFFFSRVDTSGSINLFKHFSGGSAWEISSDSAGNIYLLGGINLGDTIDFGNGVLLYEDEEQQGDGNSSHFISKFTPLGTTLFIKNLGSTYYKPLKNLGVANSGNFYLTKWQRYDGFDLAAFDTYGNPLWFRNNDAYNGDCNSLLIDGNENIWLAGYLVPGGGNYPYPFLWKYDSSGVLKDRVLQNVQVFGNYITVDDQNNFYLSGTYLDSQVFGNTTLYETQSKNFLAKIDGNYPKSDFKIHGSYCEQQNISFTNNTFNATSVKWEFQGGQPSSSISDSTVNVVFSSPGNHTVKLISENNGFYDTLVKTITIFPKPDTPIINQYSNVLSSSIDSSLQWFFEGDSIRLANNPEYEITLEGNYTVFYTDTNGCYSMSEPYYAVFDGIATSYPVSTLCWIKTVKGNFLGMNRTGICSTLDNGYIVCGTGTIDSIHNSAIIIKYDSTGNHIWAKVIQPNGIWAHDIQQTSDSGYFVLGSYGGWYIVITRLDKMGNYISSGAFKSTEVFARMKSFYPTDDGGFICIGNLNSSLTYLLKIDNTGNGQWAKVITAGFSEGNSVLQDNSNYFLSGFIGYDGSNNFLLKTDSSGQIIWRKYYKGLGGMGISTSLIQANGGGFIMTGSTKNESHGGYDIYLMKLGNAGTVAWCKLYGTVYNEMAEALIETANGYAVLGSTEGFKTKKDLYLMEVDFDGNLLWSRSYGSEENDIGEAVVMADDHGFAITGLFNGKNIFLKTDSLGNTGCRSIIVHTKTKDFLPLVTNYNVQGYFEIIPDSITINAETISLSDSNECFIENQTAVSASQNKISLISLTDVFPVPSNGIITISTDGIPIEKLQLFSPLGELLYSISYKEFSGKNVTLNMDLSLLSKSIYFLEIEAAGKKEMKKIILQ